MKTLEVLLERNKAFAVQQVAAGTLMPSLSEAVQHLKAIIIACADMRVDPTDVLGLKPESGVCVSPVVLTGQVVCPFRLVGGVADE